MGIKEEFNNSSKFSFDKSEINDEEDLISNNFCDEIIIHKHKLDNTFDYDYIDVACESNKTLLLVKFHKNYHNSLFILGENNILNVNKDDTKDSINLTNNLNFEELKIKKIYSKKNSSLLLTEDNSLYIKGSNFLNFNDEKFTKIASKFNKEIKSLELGNEHIILLTSKFFFIFKTQMNFMYMEITHTVN